MRRSVLLLCLFLPVGCAGTREAATTPTLVFVGDAIETLDPELGRVEAIAFRDGRVLAAGAREEVHRLAGAAAEVRDLDAGALLMPGFIEAHAHFTGLGRTSFIVDLVGCTSEAEMVARVAAAAEGREPDVWIEGRGWDQNRWPSRRFPTHTALSRALPDHPCVLTRVDGHALLANAAAMLAAGVDASTPDPAGGEIVRDAAGSPTGVFVDAAEGLIRAAVPRPAAAETARWLLEAQRICFVNGITSFHDCGTDERTIAVMERLFADDEMKLRLYVMLGGSGTTADDLDLTARPRIGLADGRLTVRAWKVGIDGALGSRGAAMLEDYSDRPGHRGLLLMNEDELHDLSATALAGGWQVCVHAIGDRGNRIALDAWDRLFAARPEGRRARFRVEHAQILDRDDIPRFAELGVIASMQTNHGTSDLPWAADRIGTARVEEGAYAWREIIESGAAFCNGTDAPVEDVSPLLNLRSAMLRDWGSGIPESGYHARQRLTLDEALASYTRGGAFAAFEEDSKGTLTPGKVADFIILDRDLRATPAADFDDVRVLETWVAGECVHRRR